MIKNKITLALSAVLIPATTLAVEIETIEITATKQSQSIQEVPYNVSAVNGDFMERTGITDMAGVSRSLPGVTFTDKGPRSAGSFANSISMRGMNIDGSGRQADRAGSTAPTVASYVGNTPLFTGLRLKDIERVEVLRGPQGTLYGSGAMGGIVKLIQKKPDLMSTTAQVSTLFSQTKGSGGWNNETDVIFNVPLGDKVAVRANIGRVDNDGFIDNPSVYQLDAAGEPALSPGASIATGAPVFQDKINDANNEDITNARVSVLFQASDETSFLLTHHRQKDDIAGRQSYSPNLSENQLGNLIAEPYDRELDITSLDIESDLGFASMTISAATSKVEGRQIEDVSGFYGPDTHLHSADSLGGIDLGGVDLWTAYYGNNPRFLAVSDRSWEDQNDTYELRFNSNSSSDFSWVAGFNYHKQSGFVKQQDSNPGRGTWMTDFANNDGTLTNTDGSASTVTGNDFLPGGDFSWVALTTPEDLVYFFDNEFEFTDKSFFGELTYHINPAWQVTGGVRFFDQEYTSNQEGGLVVGGAISEETRTFSKKDQLFKLNTSYDLAEDMMLFSTFSQGFRRGGANALPEKVFGAPVDAALFSYQPDEVDSFEVGLKGTIENNYNYTLTAFKIAWDNPQINVSLTELSLLGVAGGGKAENSGVEFEISGAVTEDLIVGFGYSFVNAEITEGYTYANKGEKLPVPAHTASLNVDYFQSLENSMELVYHAGISYRSATPSGVKGTKPGQIKQYARYDGFTLMDASITLNHEEWSVRGFINNIGNEKGSVGGNTRPLYNVPGEAVSLVRPRTIGMSFTYRFEL